MPVAPQYTWEQTLEGLTIRVQLPGITRCRPDVFATSALLKINALPYLLHLDLRHDVDDARTVAAVTDQGVTVSLHKVPHSRRHQTSLQWRLPSHATARPHCAHGWSPRCGMGWWRWA